MPEKEKIEFTVAPEASGGRLDQILAANITGLSRACLQKMVKNSKVTVSGKVCTVPRTALKSGDVVSVEMPEVKSTVIAAENFAFPVLYEDDFMLVINKPAGVVVHPAPGNTTGTVVNALLGRYPGMDEAFSDDAGRPGIVHRLDKDTSGILVIAKTPAAQANLSRAFADRLTSKTYLAIAKGVPAKPLTELNTLIGRHPVNRQKMAVVERNGKEAITRFTLKKSGKIGTMRVSLLKVTILTGRTHQIRVHLAHSGLPVLGDELYGGARDLPIAVPRQMLHAHILEIPHPDTGEKMVFTAPVPEDFNQIVEQITFSDGTPSR